MGLNAAKSLDLLETRHIYQVLDNLTDAAVCVDTQLRLVFLNLAALQFFGLTPESALGHDLKMLLPADYHNIYKRFMRRCQQEKPERLRNRLFRVKLFSQYSRLTVPVSLSISLIDNTEAGQLTIAIIRRRMSVRAWADSQESLASALKESLAAVGHEIRNPLVAIGGFIRRVARDPGLNEKSARDLAIIQEEVGRLERLVAGLRDLTKATAYRFEYTDMDRLLHHVCDIMRPMLSEEQKKLSLDMGFNPPPLLLDKDAICQVLLNLTRNALQASEAGARVLIRLSQAARNDFLRLDIIDYGRGMSAEQMGRLFHPFFTTKKGGTGLGLVISKRIVEDHGGHLEVKSQPDQGTTVSIYLPL